MIDVAKLTLGEIDKIETLSGMSISVLGEESTPKGKMMAALAFITKRREQMAEGLPPVYSWNEALALTMDEANEILGLNASAADEADAEDGDAEPAAPNRAARRAVKPPKVKNPGVVELAAEPDPTPGE